MWIRRIWCLYWTATTTKRNITQSSWTLPTFIKLQATATSERKFIYPVDFSSFPRKFSSWISSKIECLRSSLQESSFLERTRLLSHARKLSPCAFIGRETKLDSLKRSRCRQRLSLTVTVMSRKSCVISSFATFFSGLGSTHSFRRTSKPTNRHQSNFTFQWHQKWFKFKLICWI